MDRSYLLHSASLPSIEAMGVGEFRSHIFSNSTLKPRILQGACNLINDTRQGLQNRENDNMLLKSIAMFHTLAVYTTDFEPKFLSDSQYFFLSWAKEKIFAKSLAEYINESGDLISHEFQMCNIFGLDSSTKGSLETYIDDILIEHQQERLLNLEDVSELMERNAVDLLKRLFSLLQRRRLGEKLKVPFEAFIVKQGSKIIFDEKREHEMVIRLLDFKKKLNYFWEYAFGMHEGLGHTLREAFENFINMTKRSSMTWGTDNPKPGEMIAKYVDMILKGGAKAIPINISPEAKSKRTLAIDLDSPSEDEDSEITKQLDQVLDLFRFVHGKAVFEAFYKRDLARRLLLGRSASADAEKSMLTRLKSGKSAS